MSAPGAVGVRVGYRASWLRSTGLALDADYALRRGTVVKLSQYGETGARVPTVATVRWDDGETNRALAFNLHEIGTPNTFDGDWATEQRIERESLYGPEPVEQPPWCDRCGRAHSDAIGCDDL